MDGTSKFESSLTEEEANDAAVLFRALASPVRLRILSLLSRHEGSMCVEEITECFTLEQASISHHLRFLCKAGLIEQRRRKRTYRYYYIRRNRLNCAFEIIEALV